MLYLYLGHSGLEFERSNWLVSQEVQFFYNYLIGIKLDENSNIKYEGYILF